MLALSLVPFECRLVNIDLDQDRLALGREIGPRHLGTHPIIDRAGVRHLPGDLDDALECAAVTRPSGAVPFTKL